MRINLHAKFVFCCAVVAAVPVVSLAAPVPRQVTGLFIINAESPDRPDLHPGDGLCANDRGVCGLRAAIEEANASTAAHLLLLPTGTIKLRSQLTITGHVGIVGAGSDRTVITAANRSRVLAIASQAVATLTDVTLEKGNAEEGGVIRNEGTGEAVRCVIAAGRARRGAGLYNVGRFRAVDTLFDNHHDAPPQGLGGCIHNRGDLELDRVTLKRGQARLGCGGGIYNAATGNVEAINTTIMRNRSRRARAGGVCNDGGRFRCINCTIARNQANNTAGGILNLGGLVELENTVLVGNWQAQYGRGSNCAGTPISSLGHNLEDGVSCDLNAAGDLSNVAFDIRGLHQLEGFVPVAAIKRSSLAIDAGDAGACPALDARGLPRPSGTACDVGAFEYQFDD